MTKRAKHAIFKAVWVLILVAASKTLADTADQPLNPPRRPADFKPFLFKYSTEQLMETYSTNQMQRAAEELKQIQATNETGTWKPTWDSLDQHQAPEWFLVSSAKFMGRFFRFREPS